jgi:uncharacterized protein YjiS (DUF1127 family)
VPRDGGTAPHPTRRSRLGWLWREWRQRIYQRRLAAQFTECDLRDVGLTRAEVNREISRPFWRMVFGPPMAGGGVAW